MRRRPVKIPTAAAALAAALALSALAGCGVPAEGKPHVVRDGDVPFDLLSPTTVLPSPPPSTGTAPTQS